MRPALRITVSRRRSPSPSSSRSSSVPSCSDRVPNDQICTCLPRLYAPSYSPLDTFHIRTAPSVVPAAISVPARRVVREVTPMRRSSFDRSVPGPDDGAPRLRPPPPPVPISSASFSSISHMAARLGMRPRVKQCWFCRLSYEESGWELIRASWASQTQTEPSLQLDTSMVPGGSSSSGSTSTFGQSKGINARELNVVMLVMGWVCPVNFPVHIHHMALFTWPVPHSLVRLYRQMAPDASPANSAASLRSPPPPRR
mmetsp:Transcript_26451/g.56256  ORF Transcript_26451/g.56256 Transcript_26451/m.56256 type:complete len:256 (+) Transcript_26451:297-1064(+)